MPPLYLETRSIFEVSQVKKSDQVKISLMISNPFFGRKRPEPSRPLPPGQYLEDGFPVLSAGPTPRVDLTSWQFSITQNGQSLGQWSWDQLNALPQTDLLTDLHCVTKWSKHDTNWRGVTFDTLFKSANIDERAGFVMAHCDGGYTTNLPLPDLLNGKGLLVHTYEGEPLAPEHGGPVRLLVPHLYLWKSAKWVNKIDLLETDVPGFWEQYGYHMYGDPWKEQRYHGD
jgi:DMSO/TMAO reductase YedYZ molybdopterin-dependent catalytic subunit